MIPLRIRAELSEPIAYSGDGLPIDAILSAAVFREVGRRVTAHWPLAQDDEFPRDLDLPLARWACDFDGECDQRLRNAHDGRVWGWRASDVHAHWLVHTAVEVRKRCDIGAYGRWTDATDVDESAGRFKAYDLKLPARIAAWLEWYVVGDADEIRRLLERHITSLGRKRAHGNGRVMRWHVEPMAEDWSVERGGKLTRAMPRGYGHGRVAMRAVRPPCWHPSRQIVCVVPIESELVPGVR